MKDIFKTLGNIFNPTPTEELEKICNDAGIKTKEKKDKKITKKLNKKNQKSLHIKK